MQNFKFRGKVINTIFPTNIIVGIGKWVYGNLIVSDNEDCFITTWKKSDDVRYESNTYQVDPETVGQYTGLNDNKKTEEYPEGQEIYSGDLFYYHDTLRKVIYREDTASWMGIVVKGISVVVISI